MFNSDSIPPEFVVGNLYRYTLRESGKHAFAREVTCQPPHSLFSEWSHIAIGKIEDGKVFVLLEVVKHRSIPVLFKVLVAESGLLGYLALPSVHYVQPVVEVVNV